MRKLSFVLTMFFALFCSCAQAHVFKASPCGFSNFYFSPAYSRRFTPSELQDAYLEHMLESGYSSCRINDSGDPDPESCGGVDAARYIIHFAQDICRTVSDTMGMPLIYDFSTTPALALPGESHHGYRFGHGLLVSCGTCAPTPTE